MLTLARSAKLIALIKRLDRFAVAIPLRQLERLVRAAKLDIADFEPYALFGDECYRRNLVHASPAYHMLLLCWKPGQRSPIHDHHGSACCVQVLQGRATEVVFDRSDCGLVYPTETRRFSVGQVCGSFDSDMHQMGNLEAKGNLASLHIYSPPLLTMRTFHLGDAVHGEFGDRPAGARAAQARAARASSNTEVSRRANSRRKRAVHV